MQRAIRIISLMAIIIVLMGCGAARPKQTPGLVTIRLGMIPNAVNSLVLIADERGYFRSNGLQVSVVSYPSGFAAVNGMKKGEVDAATAAEYVVVGEAMNNEPVRVWATIDRYLHHYLIPRKDHGIRQVDDLPGKKIGLPLHTDIEFHLGRYLELNGVNLNQVILVDSSPDHLARLLEAGKVDSVAIWQPEAAAIKQRLGKAVLLWPVQSGQASFFNLLSTEEWTRQHPAQVEAFLRALHEAEVFYATQPEETKAILQRRLVLGDEDIDTMWAEHQFQLSLDQALILAMEDEARWKINHRMSQAKDPPDFLKFIYLDGMQSVRPEAVNIIR